MLNRTSFAKFSLAAAIVVLAGCASTTTPAPKAAAPATPAAIKIDGERLTDKTGMSLYTFDKDVAGSGASACNNACADAWPPLGAADAAKDMGDFTVITRADGRRQWAYKGKPLHLSTGDTKSGDTTGNGKGGVWRLAKR